ncbi:Uncharacterised protein [Taylorella equigenitalis ATCC 35865]|nr:Uncharacterised protein [Taylorella equigenitalis ATCC 35865]
MALTDQPRTRGCVFKLFSIIACVTPNSQPRTRGCVFKRKKHRIEKALIGQPRTRGCVFKLCRNYTVTTEPVSHVRVAVCLN